jgi:hypothetical protein
MAPISAPMFMVLASGIRNEKKYNKWYKEIPRVFLLYS